MQYIFLYNHSECCIMNKLQRGKKGSRKTNKEVTTFVLMGLTKEVTVEMGELKIYSGVEPLRSGKQLDVRPERRLKKKNQG